MLSHFSLSWNTVSLRELSSLSLFVSSVSFSTKLFLSILIVPLLKLMFPSDSIDAINCFLVLSSSSSPSAIFSLTFNSSLLTLSARTKSLLRSASAPWSVSLFASIVAFAFSCSVLFFSIDFSAFKICSLKKEIRASSTFISPEDFSIPTRFSKSSSL